MCIYLINATGAFIFCFKFEFLRLLLYLTIELCDYYEDNSAKGLVMMYYYCINTV